MLDRADAADLMDVIRHELGFSNKDKRFPRKDTCLAIYSYRINTRLSLKQTLEEQFPWVSEWEQDLTRLYREYVGRKQKNNVLDFDDLLLYWHVMMQNPALAQNLSSNFDHVLVDEYQDTSALQGEIIQLLKPDGAGVTVVGDDAQAIYSFRAAAVENILGFADRFKPKADMVVLAQNYRSTQPILDCANALMSEGARQHRKTLLGMRQASQKPFYVTLDDAAGQAEYIVNKILATREIGGSLKRHAILFRSSHHSDVLEVELTKRNIPYVKYGGLKFLEAAHVKDMLSILRWVDNPRNAVAGFRVLKLHPGFGPAHAKQALDYFEAQGFSVKSLAAFEAPQPVKMDWKRFCTLLEKLADPATPWPGQVGLVRDWYKPQLERIYESAWTRTGDLEQLEQLSSQQPSRERFLTELTLDPPAAHRRTVHGRLQGRGLRHPLHDPFRKRPGMGHRLHIERRRRQLPVGILNRQTGDDRGRAAPAVRGHDPRPQRASPVRTAQVCRDSTGQGRRRARLRRKEPLHDQQGARLLRAHHFPQPARRREPGRGRGGDRGRRGAAQRDVVSGHTTVQDPGIPLQGRP